MGKSEKHEGKKYLMVDDYMLDKVLERIKGVLADADDKLSDDITFKNVVILTAYVIKDDGKFSPQIFLEKHIFLNKHGNNKWWKNYVGKKDRWKEEVESILTD